jgi:hypothetical protein
MVFFFVYMEFMRCMTDHRIKTTTLGRDWESIELDFRCQCTQHLTFDPQLKKILTFSVKDRYQLYYFICIKDLNTETIL